MAKDGQHLFMYLLSILGKVAINILGPLFNWIDFLLLSCKSFSIF